MILTGGAVIASTIVAALAAFAIANMRFRGRELLLSANVALMVVPPVVMLIPLFIQFTELGLVSTYRGVILIYAGLTAPFSVYLLASFFRTLPNELFESATIDGAGHFRILWSIVLPLARPGAGDADHRQLAVGLERAAGRAGVPAGRAAEDADGRRDAVPGPLLAERAGADGRACWSRRRRWRCCTWPASATSSAASRPGRSRDRRIDVRRFEGRSVLVTGAGRGIGQATAERFASEGADVTLVGRSPDPLNAVADGIRAAGGSATVHACDVRDGDAADAAVAALVARHGKLDVVVNNAGIDDDTPVPRHRPDALARRRRRPT